MSNSSQAQQSPRRSWQTVLVWLLQALGAAVFFAAGTAKLAGAASMIETFAAIEQATGIGQWFRYLTGALEVGGGVLLLVPALATAGGLLLASVMIGAALTHILFIGGSPVPACILLLLVTTIAWLRRGEFRGAA